MESLPVFGKISFRARSAIMFLSVSTTLSDAFRGSYISAVFFSACTGPSSVIFGRDKLKAPIVINMIFRITVLFAVFGIAVKLIPVDIKIGDAVLYRINIHTMLISYVAASNKK